MNTSNLVELEIISKLILRIMVYNIVLVLYCYCIPVTQKVYNSFKY